jgi:hypothetical protein
MALRGCISLTESCWPNSAYGCSNKPHRRGPVYLFTKSSVKFRRFVILVSIRSGWIHLSTLSSFAGPLQFSHGGFFQQNKPSPKVLNLRCERSQHGNCCMIERCGAASQQKNRPFILTTATSGRQIHRLWDEPNFRFFGLGFLRSIAPKSPYTPTPELA